MIAGVLEQLPARFVFVVGKGGVGKSTTAAALALRLADEGMETHLLSTDPAHSLGDLFERQIPSGEPVECPCSARLTLEELDASARARAWSEEVHGAVAEILHHGTYLERDDVEALLDRSLPGMGEIMAALRIGELDGVEALDRVVVDTAPTGHTLRLLSCGTVVQGWVTALEAMADKACAVAMGLTGRRVRLAGERVMEELSTDVRRFTEQVLPRADFVVVTRDGSVVSAETERLQRDLRKRGLRIGATVRVGTNPSGGRNDAIFDVPPNRGLVGCEGLREWGAPTLDSPDAKTIGSPRDDDDPRPAIPVDRSVDPLELLGSRRIILFAGKGGVGKTTCAAAFALAIAPERPVLLLSLDPAGSLKEALDRPVGVDRTDLCAGLAARQLDAEARFARFRSDYRTRLHDTLERLGMSHSAALDRRVLESFLDMAPPGIDEIFALEAILDHTEDEEVLVIDTAPTGHFLRLLEMPRAALDWTHGLLRILLEYRTVLGLNNFAPDLLGFAKRLKALVVQLSDPERTGIVIVTLAGRLPESETDRLLTRLRSEGEAVVAVIHNQWGEDEGEPSARRGDSRDAEGELPVGRGDSWDTEGELPSQCDASATVVAPTVVPAPVGADRLRSFVSLWSAR